ncbi:MAG: AarF/UbiB family protein [Myxococcota bacterium]|nr:AarF/UbiB family protein [Myxococcota bacterium]
MAHIHRSDVGRIGEIAGVLVRHGFGHLVNRVPLLGSAHDRHSSAGAPADVASLHWSRRFRLALVELGTTFVKLGQVLSVRPDIVGSQELLTELQHLQDNVPPAPFPEVRALLETELGSALEEIFEDLDETPLASASVAQVHRASLPCGTQVAVKIQRPGIEAVIRSDLRILRELAQALTGKLEIPGLYSPMEIAKEFETAILQELDFQQEAMALQRFAANFEGHEGVVVPRLHSEWTRRRVMVMELVHGTKLTTIEDSEVAQAAMRKIIEATYLQVFEHGFFHGDPHPGNLMVLSDGRVAFLDFGLTGVLTGDMQDTLVRLFLALVGKDPDVVAMTIFHAGATRGRVDLKEFREEIARMLVKYDGASLNTLGDQASLLEFVEVAGRYRIQLPQGYVMLARVGAILDGLARETLGDVDIVEEVRPLAARLARRRLSPERLTGDLFKVVQQSMFTMGDLPIQLNQVIDDLGRGNLRVRMISEDADAHRLEVRRSSARLTLSLCGVGMGIAGSALLATGLEHGHRWMEGVGLVSCALAGVLIGLALLHLFFAATLSSVRWGHGIVSVFRFLWGERDH